MRHVLNDMQLVSNALLGLHAYTGCDTVSTFSGKCKVKPLKLMMKNEKYISTFAYIKRRRRNHNIKFQCLSRICELYVHKEKSTDYVH